MYLFKLRPKLPKYTVFGYERLHPRVQRRGCHCAPIQKIASSLPLVFDSERSSLGFDKGRTSLRSRRATVQENFATHRMSTSWLACFSLFPEPRIGNACIQLAFRQLFSGLVIEHQFIHEEHAHPAIAVAAHHMG